MVRLMRQVWVFTDRLLCVTLLNPSGMRMELFYENFAVNYYYNPVGIIREQDGKYNSENTRMTGNITFEPIKKLADQPHVKP